LVIHQKITFSLILFSAGYGVIINTLSHTIINHFNLKYSEIVLLLLNFFREEAQDIQFSPDGK